MAQQIEEEARNLSNQLYNEGLELIHKKDLSNAIFALKRSIALYKYNTVARNLLGLVYYKVGKLGDSIKQWVISSNFQKENNIAVDYLESINKSQNKLNKLNSTIKMYNEALQYINQNSMDLAIIRLKKAIHINPGFIQAQNLLALCYIKQEKFHLAKQGVKKVLSMDISNKKALQYNQQLNLDDKEMSMDEKVETLLPKVNSSAYFSMQKNWITPVTQIVLFVIGAISGIALIYFLIIPDIKQKYDEVIFNNETQFNKEIRLKEEAIKENDKTIEELEKQIALLKEELDNKTLQEEKAKETERLINAVKNYFDGDLNTAALKISEIKLPKLTLQGKQIYSVLKEQTYEKAAYSLYTQGKSLYNQKEYEKAIKLFKQTRLLLDDTIYADDALYFIGRSYEILDNDSEAKKAYEQLLMQYENSNLIYDTKNRLNRLKA